MISGPMGTTGNVCASRNNAVVRFGKELERDRTLETDRCEYSFYACSFLFLYFLIQASPSLPA